MCGVRGGLLRVLVGCAVFKDGLEGLSEAVDDGFDVLGGFVNLVGQCLVVVVAVPLIRCAIDVDVKVSKLLGDLGEEHGLGAGPGENDTSELAVAEGSKSSFVSFAVFWI